MMSKAKRILVVDDDRGNRNLLQATLKSLGYESDVACDGLEAIDKVRDGFDMMLLDVTMPGMDGFETARRVRQDPECYDLPIIMVTVLSDKADRLRAVKAGANDFIAKPIDKTELEIRSASLLKRKEIRDAVKARLFELESEVEHRRQALGEARNQVALSEKLAFEAQIETITRLAKAAECRDCHTGAHIIRTQSLSAFLASRLGLPDKDVEMIYHASALHDVGKIGIPDNILLKKGHLTLEEFEIMKSHTSKGAEILADSRLEIFGIARQIALCHHERWDGAGYPNRVNGEAIPFSARIVSVIDTFDSVTSSRPYQEARPVEEACAIIDEERGKQFDPLVVDAFVANKAYISQVRQQMERNLGSFTYDAVRFGFDSLL
ncbi:MAG TPA: HD domain-containing phosphohydrolase [Desulfomonilaceae bacterium]|nr:HD domain-containing phosphohydrolase [Desulfomonilaceae bacterium]